MPRPPGLKAEARATRTATLPLPRSAALDPHPSSLSHLIRVSIPSNIFQNRRAKVRRYFWWIAWTGSKARWEEPPSREADDDECLHSWR